MVKPEFRDLSPDLSSIFSACLDELNLPNAKIPCSSGFTCNDDFPLRAYLGFKKAGGDGEVAITVDVWICNESLLFNTDITMDVGLIVAKGPALKCSHIDLTNRSTGILPEYLCDLNVFLRESRLLLLGEITRLG